MTDPRVPEPSGCLGTLWSASTPPLELRGSGLTGSKPRLHCITGTTLLDIVPFVAIGWCNFWFLSIVVGSACFDLINKRSGLINELDYSLHLLALHYWLLSFARHLLCEPRLMRTFYFLVFVFGNGYFDGKEKKGQEASRSGASRTLLSPEKDLDVEYYQIEETSTSPEWSPLQGFTPSCSHCPADSKDDDTFMAMPAMLEGEQPQACLLPQMRQGMEEGPRPRVHPTGIAADRQELLQQLGRKLGYMAATVAECFQEYYTQEPSAEKPSPQPIQGERPREGQRKEGWRQRFQRCWRENRQRIKRQWWKTAETISFDAGTCTRLECFRNPSAERDCADPEKDDHCGAASTRTDRSFAGGRNDALCTSAECPCRASTEVRKGCSTRRTARDQWGSVKSIPSKKAAEYCKGCENCSPTNLERPHCGQPGPVERLCNRISGTGSSHQHTHRRGHHSFECSASQTRGSQGLDNGGSGDLRYRSDWRRQDRGSHCNQGGHGRNGSKLREFETKSRSGGSNGTASKEAQGRRRAHRRGWAYQAWFWSAGAFWHGQEVDSSVTSGVPNVNVPITCLVMKWNHGVCLTEDFISEWQACEKGQALAWEFGYTRGTADCQSEGLTGRTQRTIEAKQHKQVTFDSKIRVHYTIEDGDFDHDFTHESLRAWARKPWKLDLDHVDHPVARITYRLIDEPTPTSTLRANSAERTQLLDGVRIERPDLLGHPGWIQDGWTMFEQRARVLRRGEGPSAYARTWFLHHDRVRRWHTWREFRLDEWPQEWRHRLQELWRDQLRGDNQLHVGWVQPPVRPIPGWENHIGDIIVFQHGVEPRAAILCLTMIDLQFERRLQLQALSVPRRHGRHDLLRLCNVMIISWRNPCHIRRGERELRDGIVDHVDLSGIVINIDSSEEPRDQLQLLQIKQTLSPTTSGVTLDGPLSEMAVLNTKVNNFENRMTVDPLNDRVPKTAGDENSRPNVNDWKGLSEARQARVLTAGVHPANDDHEGQDEIIHDEEDPDDEEPEYIPPERTPPNDGSVDDQLQSVVLYQIGRAERHAYVRWHSHPALLRSVAEFLEIPIHDIYELHDLQFQPVGLLEDVYPIIVHKFDDLPTGSTDQMAVIDVVVHDRIFPSVTDRRTLRLPQQVRRAEILVIAQVDLYCDAMNQRCIVMINGNNWPLQDVGFRQLSHGVYIQIHIPPWTGEAATTVQAVARAQTRHSSAVADNVSTAQHGREPSAEPPPGPVERNEEPDLYDPSDPEQEEATTHDTDLPDEIHDDLLDVSDEFTEELLTTWGDSSSIEMEELGPVAYFATWYVSTERMRRCERPRHVGLLADHASWFRRIADLWRDIIDPGVPLVYHFVNPEPPASPTDGHIAGHIIISQHLRPFECAAHMTVIRADLRDAPHIVWAMVARRQTTKAIIYGWHLVHAVCPPMAPRNKCTCKTGTREINDGDAVLLRDGQSVFTLVERQSRAAAPGSMRLRTIIASASERRREDLTPSEEDDGGDYFGVAEFPRHASAPGPPPIVLTLQQLVPPPNVTTIVRLIQSHWHPAFPPYVEVPADYDAQEIDNALQAHGFYCQIQMFGSHDVAFCVNNQQQPITDHYIMYANIDTTDADGAFAHATDCHWNAHDHMKLLHSVGYNRAAIVDDVKISQGLQLVTFQNVSAKMIAQEKTHRQPTGWPSPQPLQTEWNRVSAKFADLPPHDELFQLSLHRSIDDVVKLLTSSAETYCTDTGHLELSDATRKAIDALPVATPDQKFDRYVIYTDGSSKAQSRRTIPDRPDDPHSGVDTWAFLVLGEDYARDEQPGKLWLVTWQAQQVLYREDSSHHIGSSRLGSEIAEREGMFWALIWRLGIDSRTPTCFRPDSLTTAGQAQGLFGAQVADLSFQCLRAAFQSLEAILPGDHLTISHARGHAGDPWNEFVDEAAKQEMIKSQYMQRQRVDMRDWLADLPFLWTYFDERSGLPPLSNHGHVPRPPELPRLSEPPPVDQVSQRLVDFKFSVCTANVGSLYREPQGHGGKIDYMRSQITAFGINILGIQESRTEAGMSHVDGILRLAGGAQGHLYGIELWVNLNQPFAYVGSKPRFFRRPDFIIAYADPRLMIAHAANDLIDCWFIVAHAPHSGRPPQERERWWRVLSDKIQRFVTNSNIFVMIDANATSGPNDETQVGPLDDVPNNNTEFLRALLQDHALCLPSTFACHTGEHTTWTSPDGLYGKRIDFVAVPQHLQQACVRSTVEEDFDLGNSLDHNLVGVDLQWRTQHDIVKRNTHARRNVPQLASWEIKDIPSASIRAHRVPDWQVNIGDHVEAFNEHVRAVISQQAPSDSKPWKKPYINDAIWARREEKITLKKELKKGRQSVRSALLQHVFGAWRDRGGEPVQGTTACLATTRCSNVCQAAKLWNVTRHLRNDLKTAKQNALAACIEELPSNSSASTILRTLRPHLGPTNPQKAKRPALPIVNNLDGSPCLTPQAALDRWIDHFMTMEGGRRVDWMEQQQLWIDNLLKLQASSVHMCWDELPTLTALEQACRQVAMDKATGPDYVPSSFVHLHCKEVARLLYGQLVKLAIHGQESLIHKGGRLAVAFKGKGPQDRCDSYRSLLVSSHAGKVLHKSLRTACTSIFSKYMQRQQLGGRKHVPVSFAVHLTRTYLRVNQQRHRSVAILSLDLKEAFYRVVRGIVVEAPQDDEMLARLAARLGLPDGALHELHELLRGDAALVQANMPAHFRKAVRALHEDTHFHLSGQKDACRTCVGTRPGDSWADVVFSFAWAKLLHGLQTELLDHGILDVFENPTVWCPFGRTDDMQFEQVPFLGPTWMDDLSLGVSGDTCAEVVQRVGIATSCLLDRCSHFGMTPNLARGKTEILLSLRGAGSRRMKTQFFGGSAPQTLPVVGSYGTVQIALVGEYVHLGNVIHHGGGHGREMSRRLGIAHQAYGAHRRTLFANPRLSLQRRAELFETLIVSKLMYGAETWVPATIQEKSRFHCGVIRLYRRLCRFPHDAALRDDTILCAGSLLSPTELIRRQRLRYLPTLYRCGDLVPWGLIGSDHEWCDLLRSDFVWMFGQLRNACQLPDPEHDFEPWRNILVNYPGYWKRLLKRSCKHAAMQRAKEHHARQAHCDLLDILQDHGDLCAQMPAKPKQMPDEYFGCMTCGVRCRSLGGEGAHMFKVHAQKAFHRRFCAGTQCAACLKEFHTIGRLSHHMRQSTRCQQILTSQCFWSEEADGEGSALHAQQERLHNGVRVAQQAAGPSLPHRADIDVTPTHRECYDLLVEHLMTSSADDFERVCRTVPKTFVISWTLFCSTLQQLWRSIQPEDWTLVVETKENMQQVFNRILTPSTWPIFREKEKATVDSYGNFDLYDMETWMLLLANHPQGPWRQAPCIERRFHREKVVLHVFSGRRRRGDLQDFMEGIAAQHPTVHLLVVSLDIVVDATYGDVCKEQTRLFWLNGIRQGYVIALLAGPPCNTWSAARGRELLVGSDLPRQGGWKGPRVVRPPDEAWGSSSLSLRELADVCTGNELLIFSLLAFVLLFLQKGYAVLEHPDEPHDANAVSIWRLPILAVIRMLPGVELHRILQGLFGAESPKPTGFLTLNLPGFISTLHKWRLVKQPPTGISIGRSASGEFLTSKLKEYPPSLCAALAQCFMDEFVQTSFDEDAQPLPEPFLQRCQDMVCKEYGLYMGPDFAGNG